MATVVYERTRQKPEGGVVTSQRDLRRGRPKGGQPAEWRVEVDDRGVTTEAIRVCVRGEGISTRYWWATIEGLAWWKPWTWAANWDPDDMEPLSIIALIMSISGVFTGFVLAATYSWLLLPPVLLAVGLMWCLAAVLAYGWDRGLTRQIDHAVQTVDRLADRWEDRAARLHAMRQIAEAEAEERREVQDALREVTATKEGQNGR